MIRKLVLLLFCMTLLVGLTNLSFATPVLSHSDWENITVYDGFSNTYDSWYGTQEDNEVEFPAATSQLFDLEGFFYNKKAGKLAIVGGYDFRGTDSGIPAGDIFLNTSTTKYALDIDYTTEGYSLWSGDDITTQAPTYVTTSPGTIRTGGGVQRVDAAGNAIVYDVDYYYNIDQSVWGTSFSGYDNDLHHALVVDVGWLNDYGINRFNVYNTMQCGNDVLRGAVVPEPSTFMLLGLGLLGFAGAGRKKLGR